MSQDKLISWKQFNDALNAYHFADAHSPILSSCNQDDPEETSYNWDNGEGETFETVIPFAVNVARFAPEGVEADENTPLLPVMENGTVTFFDEDDTKCEVYFYKPFNPFTE